MKLFVAVTLALVVATGARAISPPQSPPSTPTIIPSPPVDPNVPPPTDPGGPNPPAINTPEPSSLTIAGISLAGTGIYRFVRRRQMV
jgi:PEP-CTERM motif